MYVSPGWFSEPVTVATYSGEGAYGPVYAEPVTVLGNIDSERVLSRNADGDEVTAEQTIKLPPRARVIGGGTVDSAALLAPESTVEHLGRVSRVITSKTFTTGGRAVYVEATTT